ncbi:zinc ribbon domain-containing protein [Sutterella sp.]|uniref:zinc ribbon domain-containing protein n=1 Tax=Sutterella sp. TaxID=1981025 RepID=UPI003FD7BC54
MCFHEAPNCGSPKTVVEVPDGLLKGWVQHPETIEVPERIGRKLGKSPLAALFKPFEPAELADVRFVPASRLSQFAQAEPIAYKTVVRDLDPAAVEANREVIDDLIDSFGMELTRQLAFLKSQEYRRFCIDFEGFRELLRDKFRKENNMVPGPNGKYPPVKKSKSPYGLLDKQWKCAIQAACILASNYWKGVQRTVFRHVMKRAFYKNLNDCESAFVRRLLLVLDSDFFDMLDKKTIDTSKMVAQDGSVVRDPMRLQRTIRSILFERAGRFPVHGEHHSCWFDSDSYTLAEKNGGQQIRLATKARGSRITLGLLGRGKIDSTTMLVRDELGVVKLHVLQKLKPRPLHEYVPDIVWRNTTYCFVTAVDLGFSEAAVNEAGVAFGENLKNVIMEAVDWIDATLRGRNYFYSLFRTTKDPAKKQRILENNLGGKNWRRMLKRLKERVKNEIHRAVNALIRTTKARVIVAEDLPEKMAVPGWSKRANRMMSSWVRGLMTECLEYKAALRGMRVVYVPSAYSSQACPACYYVSRDNRHGDAFHCRACGYKDHADRKAALMLLHVLHDDRFTRYMPLERVRGVYREKYLEHCAEFKREPLPESRKPKREPKRRSKPRAALRLRAHRVVQEQKEMSRDAPSSAPTAC